MYSLGLPLIGLRLKLSFFYLSLYDKTKVKEVATRVFSSLEELFSGKAMKEAKKKMENITPFNMETMVVVPLPLVRFALCYCFLISCFYDL